MWPAADVPPRHGTPVLARWPEGHQAPLAFGREVGHSGSGDPSAGTFVGASTGGRRAVVTGAAAATRRDKVLLPTLLRAGTTSLVCVDPSGLLHEGVRASRSDLGPTRVVDLAAIPAIDPLDAWWRGGSDEVVEWIVALAVPGMTPDDLFLAAGLRSALGRYLETTRRGHLAASLVDFLAWSRRHDLGFFSPFPEEARQLFPRSFEGDGEDGVSVPGAAVAAVVEAAFGWLDGAPASEPLDPSALDGRDPGSATFLVGACPWAPMAPLVLWAVLRALAARRTVAYGPPPPETLVVADLSGEWPATPMARDFAGAVASAAVPSDPGGFTFVASLDDPRAVARLSRVSSYRVSVEAGEIVDWDGHDLEVRAPHGAFARLRSLGVPPVAESPYPFAPAGPRLVASTPVLPSRARPSVGD